jgi:DNA-binding PadR family transcriptional regulator
VADAPLTPAVFALLLGLGEGQRHGYALISDVEQLTDGTIRLGPGTLYRSLQRMRVEGLIEELDDAGPVDDRRAERRRSYRITEAGRDAACAEARRLAVFVEAAKQRGMFGEGADDER